MKLPKAIAHWNYRVISISPAAKTSSSLRSMMISSLLLHNFLGFA
jgi:hypothetical protein